MEESKTLQAKIEVIREQVKVFDDFPKPGVQFVDYFSITKDPAVSKILKEATIEKID